jgi:hypothetical protein
LGAGIICGRDDERNAEDIVGACGQEAGNRADHDRSPEQAAAASSIGKRQAYEQCRGGDQYPKREQPHRAEAVELGEQAPDRGSREHEYDRSRSGRPTKEGQCLRHDASIFRLSDGSVRGSPVLSDGDACESIHTCVAIASASVGEGCPIACAPVLRSDDQNRRDSCGFGALVDHHRGLTLALLAIILTGSPLTLSCVGARSFARRSDSPLCLGSARRGFYTLVATTRRLATLVMRWARTKRSARAENGGHNLNNSICLAVGEYAAERGCHESH